MLYGLLTGQMLYSQPTRCFTKQLPQKCRPFYLYLPEGIYLHHAPFNILAVLQPSCDQEL